MKDEKGILVFNFWTEFDSSRSAESVWPPHLPPSSLLGRGVRPTRLFELPAPTQSPFCWDESRPDN